MSLREKLDAWIGSANVKVQWVPRGTHKDANGAQHGAYIGVRDGVLCFDISIEENVRDLPGVLNSFILSHDIGHFLAADDTDLFQPNLGLGVGPTGREEWERANEERTLAYQWVLLRSLGWERTDHRMNVALKVLAAVVRVSKARVDALIAALTPEAVRAEWDRKLALIAEVSRVPAGVGA